MVFVNKQSKTQPSVLSMERELYTENVIQKIVNSN